MKKVFVSQPFGDKNKEELREEAEIGVRLLEEYLEEELELIDSWIEEDCPDEVERIPVWYLGKSVELMAEADVVLFLEGWIGARGCCVEYEVARRYEINCFERTENKVTVLTYVEE